MRSYLAFNKWGPRIFFCGALFGGVNKIDDLESMQLAWQQAQQGSGHTWTNPVVGAVIIKHGRILARGYHHQFGERHAEIDALAHLANVTQARGATMVVTLEPCSHYGKTPPCADRLIAVGIARVVIGQLDPNPVVQGRGVAKLRAAGIPVTVLNQTGGLNAAYNLFYQQHRPLVTLKVAMSLDGKLNGPTRHRTQLTGPAAFQDTQQLRARQQAILIGEHTLRQDNPQLTVRSQHLPVVPWRLVVVDAADTLPESLRLFQTPAPIWLLSKQPTQRGWPPYVHVVAGDWTPIAVRGWAYQHGVQALLLEGGSRLQADWLAADLIDRFRVYLTPKVLGGTALPVAQGLVGTPLQDFRLTVMRQLGPDVCLAYRREKHV